MVDVKPRVFCDFRLEGYSENIVGNVFWPFHMYAFSCIDLSLLHFAALNLSFSSI